MRSQVWEIATPLGPRVIKAGPVARVAREAGTLAQLRGTGCGPELVAAGEGILVTVRCEGDPRPGESWGVEGARLLGALIARTHRTRVTSWCDLPDGSGRMLSFEDYLRVRNERQRGSATAAQRKILDDAIARAPTPDSHGAVRQHGDLWSGNVLWCADGPVLVDWEYSHQGDRAEDLAYLIEMDGLRRALRDAVLDGYGADDELRRRVERWRPLVAVWSGLWFAEHGEPERCARLFARAKRQLRPRTA
jgi:Ser/Thr protein kinase RdoA (MazF antagonist)